MRIAIIGGGASGMATAYLLDKQGHHVTVLEEQPMLGGHIRTLNKNVKPNHSDCQERLESGVLEFPTVFHNFLTLMQELGVEMVPVRVGSALFPKNGGHFLSGVMIEENFTGIQRLIEYLRFDSLYARSIRVWLETRFATVKDFYNQPLSKYLKDQNTSNLWLKLATMYSYSMPFELIDNFPAELALPMLRDYIAVEWLRVEGGVYSYIEKILERFQGEVYLNVEIANIFRSPDAVKVERSNGEIQEFDKVVFATPPDQVMALLGDPTDAEVKRFSNWQANYATTTVHRDASMYDKHGIQHPSEFDFFQTNSRWGYNSYLNQLSGVSSPPHYFLSFQLEELIAKDCIIHTQKHHTPLYETHSFCYRDEVVETNGENNTYHVGAYLGDGLHEGAIAKSIEQADGFAQVFPEHKFHIVDVLQKRGHIVGMTGDGVNDAPALKKADCGIAVSEATDAARAAADIVLLTPGLSVIIDAIKESRRIFQRMNSYAIYRITETLRVLLFMTLSILVFNFYPVTAVMIVMLALLNDGAILSIAYDRVHYRDQPEAWDMRTVLGISTVLGVMGVISAFGLFYLGERVFHIDRAHIQTLMYLKLSVAGHLTIFLTRTQGPFWSIRPAKILWIAVLGTQILATLIAVYGIFMTPLGWGWALFVWGYALVWFLVNDRVKLLAYRLLSMPRSRRRRRLNKA